MMQADQDIGYPVRSLWTGHWWPQCPRSGTDLLNYCMWAAVSVLHIFFNNTR